MQPHTLAQPHTHTLAKPHTHWLSHTHTHTHTRAHTRTHTHTHTYTRTLAEEHRREHLEDFGANQATLHQHREVVALVPPRPDQPEPLHCSLRLFSIVLRSPLHQFFQPPPLH